MNDIELLALVKKGRQRRYVLKHLQEKPRLVSEIQASINDEIARVKDGTLIRLSDVSRTLQTLVDAKLVICLNPPKQKGEKGILYQLTKKGLEVKELL
jgi:hypothetical protein